MICGIPECDFFSLTGFFYYDNKKPFNNLTILCLDKQNRAFEDIVFQIQNSIISGELKPGDKLPSENKLLEIFKISRGTLREAFRVLEQKGLIKVKTGVKGGAIVCSIDTQHVSDSLDLLLQFQKISLGELAKFREAAEGIVAAEAAKKAKKEDIQYLQFLLTSINNKLLMKLLRKKKNFI